ncbi:hypothetical protein DY000_02022801 [Brassica cretica]|uniref:Uncharacterized protein n=1 Tax=Brassica cretica TaxID=69181 RepID=A0ABQ7DZT9_BRACR|nr:hypothetical protein DY000_02022801 [Brassica cretica]
MTGELQSRLRWLGFVAIRISFWNWCWRPRDTSGAGVTLKIHRQQSFCWSWTPGDGIVSDNLIWKPSVFNQSGY